MAVATDKNDAEESDIEKGTVASSSTDGRRRAKPLSLGDDIAVGARSKQWVKKYERYTMASNLEARGIRRVEPDERHDMKQLGYTQVFVLWFSINLAANNITLGMLGPAVFYLSFLDASLCAVSGTLLGCLPVAYIATFGPRSGHRTLVFARYIMGYHPAKLIVVLNLIVLLGYAMIDAVVAGQILSAVSPGASLSVVVGIIIVAIISWVISTFGYRIFHVYERFAWIPSIVVFSILAGVAGPQFDLASPSQGDPRTRVGDRLSFFGICLAAAITYSGASADYFVYYPEKTPRWKIFGMTLAGLILSFIYALILGVGLGAGTATNQAWEAAYGISQGALIVEGFSPLGTFGHFCSVLTALGLIANIIPPAYSSGVDFQILGRVFERIPRVFWNTVGVVTFTVCALAGREHLAEIFTNFLAIMGYWVSIFVAIMLEEQLIFRWHKGFDWTVWDNRKALPIGIAALLAFLVGWAGAIISMAQVWYVGPIAKLVGESGADMGNYVGFSWAALVYPPLRFVELRKFGR